MKLRTSKCRFAALVASLATACGAPSAGGSSTTAVATATPASVAAWGVVYGVLQHPRCLNCHPAGDVPLQGDDSHAHAQNVRRGADGEGLYAMRCDACHQQANLAGAHLPPGASGWHLPDEKMALVFEGRSSADLCRQVRDPLRNGGRSPAQILEHVDRDPLVLWGWGPGEGRTPVQTSHTDFVQAVRTWIAKGCGCPDP